MSQRSIELADRAARLAARGISHFPNFHASLLRALDPQGTRPLRTVRPDTLPLPVTTVQVLPEVPARVEVVPFPDSMRHHLERRITDAIRFGHPSNIAYNIQMTFEEWHAQQGHKGRKDIPSQYQGLVDQLVTTAFRQHATAGVDWILQETATHTQHGENELLTSTGDRLQELFELSKQLDEPITRPSTTPDQPPTPVTYLQALQERERIMEENLATGLEYRAENIGSIVRDGTISGVDTYHRKTFDWITRMKTRGYIVVQEGQGPVVDRDKKMVYLEAVVDTERQAVQQNLAKGAQHLLNSAGDLLRMGFSDPFHCLRDMGVYVQYAQALGDVINKDLPTFTNEEVTQFNPHLLDEAVQDIVQANISHGINAAGQAFVARAHEQDLGSLSLLMFASDRLSQYIDLYTQYAAGSISPAPTREGFLQQVSDASLQRIAETVRQRALKLRGARFVVGSEVANLEKELALVSEIAQAKAVVHTDSGIYAIFAEAESAFGEIKSAAAKRRKAPTPTGSN